MTGLVGESHVYLRDVSQDRRTSLSVIANYIPPGAQVLDLGTGSGAMGQYLTSHRQCEVDGVTYNEQEAELARPHYRRVEVADLEFSAWVAAFTAQTYDFIICADVIEHLRQPETVLNHCRKLLKPGGKLLISVPNAAYCGLIAELMEGDFSYRDEGLLDRTHLRFFTRKSLLSFLDDAGWHCDQIDSIDLPAIDSEFKAPLDRLPPAVERYLLSLPDASVYQLLVVAQPVDRALPLDTTANRAPEVAKALFSAQLYVGDASGFLEDNKVVVAGEIGNLRQTLRFDLPASALTRLRLDPADRPGFLHLHSIRLLAGNAPVWRWHCENDGLSTLLDCAQQEMTLRMPWAASCAMALLYGDDPWIELPIPGDTVRDCALSGQGALEIEVGWPMSADYLSLSQTLSQTLSPLHAQIGQLKHDVQQAQAHANELQSQAQRTIQTLEQNLERAQAHANDLQSQAQRAIQTLEESLSETHQSLAQSQESLRQESQAAQAALAQANRLTGEIEQALAQAQTARSDAQRNHSEKMQALAELTESLTATANAKNELSLATRISHEYVQAQQQSTVALTTENQWLAGEKQRLTLEKNNLTRQILLLRTQASQAQLRMQGLIDHLAWIENSTVFRATRPLVHAKMFMSKLFSPQRQQAVAQLPASTQAGAHTVDIIVPVYKSLQDTQRCIESVLASTCKTPWRLVVVNDCSPEPEVTQWLRDFCPTDARIVLLENATNLGFVGTVNRGMGVSTSHDVLLLNSDTEVANDWLDRLRHAAYSDARVASVTPFSNNATICSYPKFCEANDLPSGWDTAGLDALCAKVNAGQAVDVPTGVGFCMYIRRDCLNEVGLFDVEQFGKGYGEENDFCCRAHALGWRNLHALDTFVLHTGGVSFGDSKSAREREAVEKLRRLHPSYEPAVHAFVNRDPAAPARLALDVARIRDSDKPCVLAVLHDRAGGTLRHVHELALHLREEAQFLVLTPAPGGAVLLDTVPADGGTLKLRYQIPQQWPAFLQTLQMLGVVHIHYHHLLGHQGEIFELGDALGLTWDVTAHDYFSICPQISLTDYTDQYCGEEGESQCVKCLKRTPAPGNMDIVGWRSAHGQVLSRARYVLTPSQDAGQHLQSILHLRNLRHAPHTDIADPKRLRSPTVARLNPDAPLRIAVLGGLSRIKGADLLEAVASLAAKQGAPVEFHLLGHAYRSLQHRPKAALTVHGAYEESELPQLLEWLKPDLVWFPALWPETYSYTLSACLVAGLPVVAPNLGAFPERLSGRSWTWLLPWNTSAADFLSRLLQIRTENFIPGVSPKLNWSLNPSTVDVPWSYKRDYLVGLATKDMQIQMPLDVLAAQRGAPSGTLMDFGARGIKSKLLQLIVWTRAAPVMRPIARAIPLRLQTRVKSWLRA